MAVRSVPVVTFKQRQCDLPLDLPKENGTFASTDATVSSTSKMSQMNCEILDEPAVSPDLSSHFMCCYCDFTASTNQELDNHMHQHVIKCFLCIFVSFSKSQLAKHVRHQHSDLMFSNSSDYLEDKDPCTMCAYCDFMTYSTELLEKHTMSRHQEEKSVKSFTQKMILKSVSAKVRESDALFYSSLVFEINASDEEIIRDNYELSSKAIISDSQEDQYIEAFNYLSNSHLDEQLLKADSSSSAKPDSVTTVLVENVPNETILDPSTQDNHVKKESMYCLSCLYCDVALDKLKFHMFRRHPTRAAVVGNRPSPKDVADKLPDVTFFCIKETCSLSTTICSVYEEHLMLCCSIQQKLSENERERLKSSLKCVLDFHEKHSLEAVSGLSDFVSAVNKLYLPIQDPGIQKEDQGYIYNVNFKEQNSSVKIQQKKFIIQDWADECHGDSQAKISKKEADQMKDFHSRPLYQLNFLERIDLEYHLRDEHNDQQSKIMQETKVLIASDLQKSCPGKDQALFPKNSYIDKGNCATGQSNSSMYSHGMQQNQTVTHLETESFKCSKCAKSFTCKSELAIHLNMHIEERPHKCNVCGRQFIIRDQMVEHMKIHTSEKPFICKVCGKNFSQHRHLTFHMITHTEKRPLLRCNERGKRLLTKSHLKMHMRTHTGERPYKCKKCDKSYTSLSDLLTHEVKHTENLYKCSVCDKTFGRKPDLKKHVVTHSGTKPFQCNECGKCFRIKYQLLQHIKTHTGEKPFGCNFCGKKFTCKSNLQAHRRTHTGEKPFKCNICDKSFCQSTSLHIHMRFHRGERPYMCSLCGQQFYTSSHLNVHMRRHLGVKPFKCIECGKSFQESTFLNNHMLTHSKEKPFQCSVCGHCFNRKSHLTTHMKTHQKDNTSVI